VARSSFSMPSRVHRACKRPLGEEASSIASARRSGTVAGRVVPRAGAARCRATSRSRKRDG
jgi:hypothetical protein